MKIKIQILLMLLSGPVTLPAIAQTKISGKVWDENNQAVPGANVYLEGTFDGTSSDVNGEFSFRTERSGTVILKATFIGFKGFRKEIELTGIPITVKVTLYEEINSMDAVVITAGAFEAGTENESEVLRPLDIVTTAGATADISGALNTLPGTQKVGEQGRLFVRGGDEYETTTFIDGMAVMDSYNQNAPNIPTRSRFSPFIFSGASFSTGGYSAEYGQGLSSVLILNTKEVATENRTDLSLISVGVEAAHTQSWEDASLAGKVSYYNLDPYYRIIKQDFNWINPPTSYDGNLAFRQKAGESGMLKSFGKFNVSNMDFNYDPFELMPGLVQTHMQNKYGHLNSSYRNIISDQWMVHSGASYTYSNHDIRRDKDLVNETERGFHFKAAGGYEYSDRLFLNMGGEILSRSHIQDFNDYESGFKNRFEFSENILASFLEGEFYFSSSLIARLGERFEYNSLNKEISIDPRISLALKTGNISQLSMAYGNFRESAPKELLRVSPYLDSEKATHVIINYQVMDNNRTFRIEGYWKQYKDLVTFNPSFPYQSESYKNSGDGYARGVDLYFRDAQSLKNVDYWISYSYLDTEREYRDYPYSASPTFTSKHNFSAVYKQFISAWRTQIGFTYSFASGRPYHDPNDGRFNGHRTPAYHDLSTNISYLARPNLIIHASLTNILNRKNIFGYEFRPGLNEEGFYEGRAVTLPSPRFLLLGVFLTLSKKGTMNQLPNL